VILVDTHVVVWLAFDQSQLSKSARAAIDDARQKGDGLAISDITLLEWATLSSEGRIRLNVSLESFLHELRRASLSYRSAAVHACALSDFQKVILRIQRIAL
jgi:PIN domain nuclease of toxin-antitoxin system